jgi:dTDP-4-dehydrorhamnose reductase
MKVLVLGGAGMLGHKAFERLRERFDVYVTFREPEKIGDATLLPYGPEGAAHNRVASPIFSHPLFASAAPGHLIGDVHADPIDSVTEAINRVRPDVVINCIGVIKQREEAKAAVPNILINALFPHQLADLCSAVRARLIHISTDCVFSGRRGTYSEADIPDPADLYGRAKLLGELNRPGCLTLRSCIVGWELRSGLGLLEWFASQRGRTIKGYRRAVFTGFATAVMVDLMADLIESHPDLSGLYQVASMPISKYDLLLRLRDALGWKDIAIVPDDQFRCDRSLVGTRFEREIRWVAPNWDRMIAALAAEWPAYHEWKTRT